MFKKSILFSLLFPLLISNSQANAMDEAPFTFDKSDEAPFTFGESEDESDEAPFGTPSKEEGAPEDILGAPAEFGKAEAEPSASEALTPKEKLIQELIVLGQRAHNLAFMGVVASYLDRVATFTDKDVDRIKGAIARVDNPTLGMGDYLDFAVEQARKGVRKLPIRGHYR